MHQDLRLIGVCRESPMHTCVLCMGSFIVYCHHFVQNPYQTTPHKDQTPHALDRQDLTSSITDYVADINDTYTLYTCLVLSCLGNSHKILKK